MFSKELELSIASLFDKAHEANIQYITVEHLLLMILSDFDVKEFFKSNDIKIENLKDDLNNHLNKNIVPKVDQQKPVQPTLGFQRVLQRAVFHIQSSGKGVVKPINILVAIFSEKESHSVFLLNKYKLSRLDVVTYLSHGPKETENKEEMSRNLLLNRINTLNLAKSRLESLKDLKIKIKTQESDSLQSSESFEIIQSEYRRAISGSQFVEDSILREREFGKENLDVFKKVRGKLSKKNDG